MAGFRELLEAAVGPYISLSAETICQLEAHFELLRKWNRVLNLTRVDSTEEAIWKHYFESLFLASCCPVKLLQLADLGSGAGFPGVPMAALWPDCNVTLVESDTRKAAFLRECKDILPNLRVECVRAENLTGSFGACVARGVRPLDVLSVSRRLQCGIGLLIAPESVSLLRLADASVTPLPNGAGVALWSGVSRGTALKAC